MIEKQYPLNDQKLTIFYTEILTRQVHLWQSFFRSENSEIEFSIHFSVIVHCIEKPHNFKIITAESNQPRTCNYWFDKTSSFLNPILFTLDLWGVIGY